MKREYCRSSANFSFSSDRNTSYFPLSKTIIYLSGPRRFSCAGSANFSFASADRKFDTLIFLLCLVPDDFTYQGDAPERLTGSLSANLFSSSAIEPAVNKSVRFSILLEHERILIV